MSDTGRVLLQNKFNFYSSFATVSTIILNTFITKIDPPDPIPTNWNSRGQSYSILKYLSMLSSVK